jgi:hypothetical protein
MSWPLQRGIDRLLQLFHNTFIRTRQRTYKIAIGDKSQTQLTNSDGQERCPLGKRPGEEDLMLRSLAIVPGLAIALALPAEAQQLTEQNARKIAEQLLQLDNKAWQDKSAAEEAALYAEDGIRVYPKGTLLGRAAVEKWFSAPMTATDWVQDPSTLDQVKVVSDNVIIFTGGWSGTWTGPKGPEVYKGRWAPTVVRDGDSWKAVLSVDNDEPHK